MFSFVLVAFRTVIGTKSVCQMRCYKISVHSDELTVLTQKAHAYNVHD